MSGEHGEPFTADGYAIRDADGIPILTTASKDDTKRITACLNALDGVATADIEAGAVRRMIFANKSDTTFGYRTSRCMAACEGMTTEQLAPGCVAKLVEALEDMLGGWRYIRQVHGDLYGVGWDRAEDKATAALAAMKGE